jgi:PAS domain S-box-containing protein
LGAADPDGTALSLNELFAGSSPDTLGSHLATLGQLGRAVTEFALAGGTRLEMTSTLVAREPALAFAVLSDVTARRRGEDESRQARQYFEAIFENLAAGVVIIDSNYEIRQVNPAFARFYRQTPRGLCGRKCHDVIHRRLTPCSMHGEVCPISSCLAAGTTVRVQHRHFDYAGRPHYQECTMAPLHDESGTIVSFVAMFADFTEIKQAQEESEAKSRTLEELNRELTAQREQLGAQASELERTNTELIRLSAAKDDFVSLVSHELRTPLTAISEGINLVADGSLGALNSSQNRFLGVAYRNCIRLGELINDLLDLSKIEAGRMDVRAERFDAAHLLRDISETFAPLAHDKGLALDVETEPGGLAVFADERLARRALTNLVNNAVKFTDAGSIRLAADRSNGTVRISICDSGIGIPEAEQPRIFERFHQVQQRDRNRPAGTGLGLALTRQMIEMNRGRIWFESREGTGTTFMFTLPVDSTASRVAALLRDRARGCATPAAAALVRITNAAELVARHGSAGVEAALTTIDSLMSHAPVRRHSGIGLPDSSEYLFLVDAGGSSCLPALREALAGATFVIHDQVTPVRLAAAVLPLGQEPDSNRLIDHLRTEATDV